MSYKVIRCGIRYGLVVVVSPATATPDDLTAEFFRYQTPTHGMAITLMPISRDAALQYFSGQAEGLGYWPLPKETFSSQDDVVEWIRRSLHPPMSAYYVRTLRRTLMKKEKLLALITDQTTRLKCELEMIESHSVGTDDKLYGKLYEE